MGRNKKYYTYNGKSLTLSEWAKETGVPKSTLNARLNVLKWTLEKTLTTSVIKKGVKSDKYTYKGKSLTLDEWSKETEVSITNLKSRLNILKWSVEKTLSTPDNFDRHYTYNGKTLSLRDWSMLCGIPLTTLRSRVSKSRWSIEKALTTPYRAGNLYTFDGRSLTLNEWSREVGISYSTLYNRINKLNWSLEKAVTTPSRPYKI